MLCNTDLFDYRPKILRLLQSIAIAGACVVAISFAAADESQPDPKSTPNELPGDAVEILVERLEELVQRLFCRPYIVMMRTMISDTLGLRRWN